MLAVCRDQLPRTAIHVLSNGRAFVRSEVVDAWAALHHPNLLWEFRFYPDRPCATPRCAAPGAFR